MRLTPDLINSSLSYLNPLKERELDLRGEFLPRACALRQSHSSYVSSTETDHAAHRPQAIKSPQSRTSLSLIHTTPLT